MDSIMTAHLTSTIGLLIFTLALPYEQSAKLLMIIVVIMLFAITHMLRKYSEALSEPTVYRASFYLTVSMPLALILLGLLYGIKNPAVIVISMAIGTICISVMLREFKREEESIRIYGARSTHQSHRKLEEILRKERELQERVLEIIEKK